MSLMQKKKPLKASSYFKISTIFWRGKPVNFWTFSCSGNILIHLLFRCKFLNSMDLSLYTVIVLNTFFKLLFFHLEAEYANISFSSSFNYKSSFGFTLGVFSNSILACVNLSNSSSIFFICNSYRVRYNRKRTSICTFNKKNSVILLLYF